MRALLPGRALGLELRRIAAHVPRPVDAVAPGRLYVAALESRREARGARRGGLEVRRASGGTVASDNQDHREQRDCHASSKPNAGLSGRRRAHRFIYLDLLVEYRRRPITDTYSLCPGF